MTDFYTQLTRLLGTIARVVNYSASGVAPGMVSRQMGLVLAAMVVAGCAGPVTEDAIGLRQEKAASAEVKVTDAVVYGQGAVRSGEMPLLLDVYEPLVPDTDRARPALLIIHGGSFLHGSRKQDALVEFAREFASRGYVVASMDYRLSGDAPELSGATRAMYEASSPELKEAFRGAGIDDKAPWAAFEDAQSALQWLHDSEESLNIDTSRVALLGGSAGALTALKVAYHLDEVAPEAMAPAAVTAIWGSVDNDDTSVMEAGAAPLLLIHGTEDKIVSINSSLVLYERAQAVGVPVELVPLEGRGHSFRENDFFAMRVESGVTVLEKIFAFTNAALFEPDKLPAARCDSFGDACP